MGLQKKSLRSLIITATAGIFFAASSAQSAVIQLPDSALSNSPGVYTSGGYYTNNIGNNIITTGGGNASNVGGANGRNDDGYMALNLGFDVTFYGTTYNSLYINNNGNVSFGSGIAAYEPNGPTGAPAPIISPFFSDVDTRNANSGVVHFSLSASQLVVTWDRVGSYSQRANALNSFQLVLRGDDYTLPHGEGSIGFFYQTMGWTASSTNSVAAAGFGNGQGDSSILQSSLTNDLHTKLNNKYIWFNANLTPVDPVGVPVPATLLLMSLGLVGLRLTRRQK